MSGEAHTEHALDASGYNCSCHARFSTKWEASEHATGIRTGPPMATGCTCMEVHGEDPACPKHGIGTTWSAENPDGEPIQ